MARTRLKSWKDVVVGDYIIDELYSGLVIAVIFQHNIEIVEFCRSDVIVITYLSTVNKRVMYTYRMGQKDFNDTIKVIYEKD